MDEVELMHLPEDGQGYGNQNNVNNQLLFLGVDIDLVYHRDLPWALVTYVQFEFSSFLTNNNRGIIPIEKENK